MFGFFSFMMCFCCFQLKEMTEQKVGLETQVDKIAREKISILAELEQAKRQIDTFDSDYNRVSSQDSPTYLCLYCPKKASTISVIFLLQMKFCKEKCC